MPTIKELREAKGKHRSQVASDLGMSERHLLRLETGRSPLHKLHRRAFANYYGVDPDTIDDHAREAVA